MRGLCRPLSRVEGLALGGPALLGVRIVKERRLHPGAHGFVMRLTQFHGELEAAFYVVERRAARPAPSS